MEHSLETPHPSIQTQDQIFKLPSSQPRYSPNLSPVPTTSSRNLKENKIWIEHTRSASFSSSNSSSSTKSRKKSLKASMKLRSSKPRNRSIAQALASPFVSRASSPTHDQGSNDLPHPKPRSRNSSKRGLSDTFYNPNLPSPRSQSHIAQSLHERDRGSIYHARSAHTSPSSKPLLLDLNTQLKQKRRKGGHRGTASVDGIYATQVDLGSGKTRKIQEGQQRERRPSAPSTYSRRSRPHALPLLVGAPGTNTRKSRLASGLEIIHNLNNDGTVATAGAPTIVTNCTDADGFVLPLLPHPSNKNLPSANIISVAPDMEMDWRVGVVDFNRPPSQLCHYPTTTMLEGWIGGDVFSSSGSEGSSGDSEEENHDEKGTAQTSRTRTRTARPFRFSSVLPPDLNLNLPTHLDLDLDMNLDQSRFGESACGISTPLKEKKIMKATSASDLRSKKGGLVRMRSLPVMGSVGERTMDLDDNVDANQEDEQGPYDQDEDMDLTNPLITDAGATSTAPGATLEDRRGDMTPWIIDSLVSPPSRFLKSQGEISKLEDTNFEDEECIQDDRGNLSFKTLSSSSSSEYDLLSSPFQLTFDSNIQFQPQPQVQVQAQPQLPASPNTTTAASVSASFTTKRTRSGTIVPYPRIPNDNPNDPPGTRRTRSGTLVGPLPLPLSASGSGVAGNGSLSARRGRERSGTILAGPPLPLPVGFGTGRTRSGTIIGPPPALVSVPVPRGSATKQTADIAEEDTLTTCNPKLSESGNMDRADEHHCEKSLDEFTNADVEDNVDLEPHIDALYVPRLSSSPDPIDFLRLAHFQDYDGMREKHLLGSGLTIKEQEDENSAAEGDEMVWCIADEPPSPVVLKNESKLGRTYTQGGGILNVGLKRNGKTNKKGRKGKGKEGKKGMMRMKTRFMIDGREEEPDEVEVEREEGEDSDDDELLLMDGATVDIWE